MSRKYLLRKDSVDERDFKFHLTVPQTLPASVDLRSLLNPDRRDQSNLGACTGNAGANWREFIRRVFEKKNQVYLSELFIYYLERKLEGTVNEDAGAEMRDLMKVLAQFGACPRSEMPYDISKFTQAPTDQEMHDALAFVIKSYHRLATVQEMMTTLANGSTFVMGIPVYASFESDSVARTGKVPLPKKGEQLLGGHAIHIVGYKKIGRTLYFIVENSWGENWGDKGFFYLPVSFVTKYLAQIDAWVGVV